MINLKQSGFCRTYSFKILVSEQKYKNNLKNFESQKKKKKKMFYHSHIYNTYVMFYYEIPWFYQDFKSENLCSVHAGRILDLSLEIMFSPPK